MIAEQLGVDHVLEGSVRQSRGRIRVTAQLIDADKDRHLLSQTFDRTLSVENVLAIQQELAIAVARTLSARLSASEIARLDASGPATMSAMEHYLDGMYLLRRWELGDFNTQDPSVYFAAMDAFNASIDADPTWAPSHAALGRLHHFFMHLDKERQLQLARAEIEESLRLDPEYGRSWVSLGYIESMVGNFAESMAAYDRAEALGARSSWGRAILYLQLARFGAAVREYRDAAAHDPLSTPVKSQLALSLFCADRPQELLVATEDLLRMDPAPTQILALRAYALARIGEAQQALSVLRRVVEETGTDEPVAGLLAMLGEEARAQAVVDHAMGNRLWIHRVAAAATLGQPARALDIAEASLLPGREIDDHFDLSCFPQVRQLVGNTRYDALLARLREAASLPDTP